jgi:Lon protease-like protein
LVAAGAASVAAALVVIPAGAAGPKDDRTRAEAILAPLESSDGGPGALVRDPVKRARDLLERGRRMRAAGDDVHARLAEAAALEWAKVASELVRTADIEAKAAAARLAVVDASAAAERERAMLEQQLAQNGRLQAELRSLEADAAPPRDGGARK